MQPIYSHLGIEEDKINKTFETILDTGEVFDYSIKYNPDYVINMPFIGQDNTQCNKCGWLRDKNYFFSQLLEEHPEIFSEENKWAIQDGDSPMCDSTFVKYNPEYKALIGEKLVHHHIGEDGQAVALPSSLHKGYGVVHNSEKAVGVTENAKLFSELVLNGYNNGVEFDWNNADKYMDSVIAKKLLNDISLKEKLCDEDKNSGQESSKSKANTKKVKQVKKTIKPSPINSRTIFNYIRSIKPSMAITYVTGAVLIFAGGTILYKKGKLDWLAKPLKNVGKTTKKVTKTAVKKIPDCIENLVNDNETNSNIGKVGVNFIKTVGSKINTEGMAQVSPFRVILDKFKGGEIDKAEMFERFKEVSNVTGKNPINYLKSLVSLHKDSDAERILYDS